MSEVNGTFDSKKIAYDDAKFLDRLRGLSIFRVVLVHLGLSWFYPPYSEFFLNLLPVLFFVSGAVSFFSFKRAVDVKSYTIKRMLSILMPYYVIVFFSFVVTFLVNNQVPSFNVGEFLNWIFVDPSHSTMPFPLGQVWFIHSMAIIILLTLPLFALSKNSITLLVFSLVLSIVISATQMFYDTNDLFYAFGHNFYQPISNMSFFLFGAIFYSARNWFGPTKLILITISGLFVAFLCVSFLDLKLNMSAHTYSPNLYYVSVSFSAICFILLAQPFIDGVLNQIKFLDQFFLFLSKNSYSVFMLHSLVLYLVEQYLNLVDVASNPLLALTKIILVVLFSCIIASPVTSLSTNIRKKIQGFMIK